MSARIGLLVTFVLAAPLSSAGEKTGPQRITWKRTVVDKVFRSEGVGVADVNKDGKKDIITGDVWYEAPSWKMHVLSKERKFDPKGWNPLNYSESFAVFPDDFNGDGWIDVIVIPFPGKECFWYENPGRSGGAWKQHELTNSACNETPIYVELFGKGQKVLVMAWQPPGSKGNMGEMCYFQPGKDPTQPWQRISISGPSEPKKEIPGTQRFSHGLGHGDVNGDGRADVLCTYGWWEQPARIDGSPWQFHPADFGTNKSICADMYAFDMDGDGKNDIISTSAHVYGFWWFQQKSDSKGANFVQHELFPLPTKVAELSKDHGLSGPELALYKAVNKVRDEQKRAPWKLSAALVAQARGAANSLQAPEKVSSSFKGDVKWGKLATTDAFDSAALAQQLLPDTDKTPLVAPRLEVGVAVSKDAAGKTVSVLVIGDSRPFSLPSQTHALHFVDINGDGQKDLVTGRRWWAHGPKGDAGPNDPAYIYWFEAKKNKEGYTTFIPHEVDDDSGIGTQFAVEDINGDGIPDIIISNKRGVFILQQVRVQAPVPGNKQD
ncbi:MAG: VCBS repeat-containing protein [Gemmataceae bacterium]|nr:VCBS repeat-containing protein [Gemmataceae bacterium]MCI0739610.1 VCBS repeat-containing protein [Gemmataceae bacterium]